MSDGQHDDTVICYGGAKPADNCFADVVATTDAELLAWLERQREVLARRARPILGRLPAEARTAALRPRALAGPCCLRNGQMLQCILVI